MSEDRSWAAVRGVSVVAGQDSPGGADASREFHAFHPATGGWSGTRFLAASDADIDDACEAAARAFAGKSGRDPRVRATALEVAADNIAALGDSLLSLASAETGLTVPRLAGERDRTVFQLRMFAGAVREGGWVEAVIDRGNPVRTPTPKPDLRRMLWPLGPVVVFGASNFPLAYSTAGGDSASALGAGCPVIVKGHPAHPGTGELVARAVSGAVVRSGMDPGYFSFLHAGASHAVEVGTRLVRDPRVRAGGFTGSLAGGMALARLAAERPDPIPFFAEMGSVNPVVLLPGALNAYAEAIAEKLVASFTASVGQMCTCPGLVFAIRGGAFERFWSEVERRVKGVVPATMLTEGIHRAWEAGLRESIGRGEGVRVVQGTSAGGMMGRATAVRVSGAAYLSHARMHEECFGPSTVVVECADLAEIDRALGTIPGSLTATVWAEPGDRPMLGGIADRLQRLAGRLIFNGVPTGVEVCPAMVHSGPYPACSRPESTAVGLLAMRRWCRPVAMQNWPQDLLPEELRDANPRGISRFEDGVLVAAKGGR